MNATKATGLGEPESIGKKNLFQPPQALKAPADKPEKKLVELTPIRIRMTLELTKKSLAIMQEIQSSYRLETGHPLPKWKVIDMAFTAYKKVHKKETSGKSD